MGAIPTTRDSRRRAIALLKRIVPFQVRFAVKELRSGTHPGRLLAMIRDQERDFARTVALLAERGRSERTLHDIVETAFHFEGSGRYRTIKPQQSKYEIKTFLEEVEKRKPRTIVEIGTGRGGTLYMYCRYLTSATRIITVDLPQSARNQWNNGRLWRTFSNRAELVFLEGDSHGSAIRSEVARLVGQEGADFIFIDGDHSYEGVKADFHGFRPMLAKGGILAMHDINLQDSGVPTFWTEIASAHGGRAVISNEPPAPGIGWIVG
jgi:cephalosporin hydroxylase